jgi:hypothetical protein
MLDAAETDNRVKIQTARAAIVTLPKLALDASPFGGREGAG